MGPKDLIVKVRERSTRPFVSPLFAGCGYRRSAETPVFFHSKSGL